MAAKEYTGPDRRDQTHCNLHHENAQKLDALVSSEQMLKWVIGIGLPMVFASAVMFYNGNQAALKGVAIDLKEVKTILIANQVDAAVIKQRLDSHEAQIEDINQRIDKRHPR